MELFSCHVYTVNVTNINIRLYIKEYDNVIKFLRLKTILYEQQRERVFLSDVIELLFYY